MRKLVGSNGFSFAIFQSLPSEIISRQAFSTLWNFPNSDDCSTFDAFASWDTCSMRWVFTSCGTGSISV
jgi:hypothetical protein